MKLYPVTHDKRAGRNGYCGPAALSTVLGISAENAAFWIRRKTNKDRVKGTGWHELVSVMNEFGLYATSEGYDPRPTLARWFKTRERDMREWPVLIGLTDHWVVVKGNMISDSGQGIVRIGQSKYRRKRVENVYVIRPRLCGAWERHCRKRDKDVWPAGEAPWEKRQGLARMEANVRNHRCTLEKGSWDHGRILDFPEGYAYSGCHSMTCFSPGDVDEYLLGMTACPADCECRSGS